MHTPYHQKRTLLDLINLSSEEQQHSDYDRYNQLREVVFAQSKLDRLNREGQQDSTYDTDTLPQEAKGAEALLPIDAKGNTALMKAIIADNTELVKRIASKIPENLREYEFTRRNNRLDSAYTLVNASNQELVRLIETNRFSPVLK